MSDKQIRKIANLMEDLAGFDEPPDSGAADGMPVDVSMGAGEEPTPGGIDTTKTETGPEEGGMSATASMLDWAQTNGCPPELCDAVRAEIGAEESPCEESGEVPDDGGEYDIEVPGEEIEAPPGAGPLKKRNDMPA
jgi:hypothetical protein